MELCKNHAKWWIANWWCFLEDKSLSQFIFLASRMAKYCTQPDFSQTHSYLIFNLFLSSKKKTSSDFMVEAFPTGVSILPTQTMHYFIQGKSLKISSKICITLILPKEGGIE